MLWRGRHEGVRFRATCRLRRGRHEGVLVWGILSHAREWSATHAAAGAAARGVRGVGGFFHTHRRDGTRSLGWWWALLGLTESSCGGGGAPARWRGRFRIFSVTANAAPENSGMTMGRDSFTCSGEDGTRELVFRATCRLRRGRHEGVLVWGILSHAREWSATHAAAGAAARGVRGIGGFFHTHRRDGTRSLGWWWALLGLTESSCGGGGAPARWRGRFRIFSVTAGTAPENSGMTMLFARRRIPPALRLRCREATAREGHCGGAVGFALEVVAGGEVESCEGEVVAARDWHGACLPGSAFWK